MNVKILQGLLIIFFEAICVASFLDIFLERKGYIKEYIIKLIPIFAFLGFFVTAIFVQDFVIKSILINITIFIMIKTFYYSAILQSVVISISYYGMLIGIDYISLILIKIFLPMKYNILLKNELSGTIIALLCKMFLLLLIVLIRKRWNKEDNLNMISNKEWLYLSCFPSFTIVLLAKMLTIYEFIDKNISDVFILVGFGLVGLNFLMFYLIHDIVGRESKIRDIKLIQERTKNQMNIYRKMYDTFEAQRKKAHDYKNQLICIQGMLSSGKVDETMTYIAKLTGNLTNDVGVIHTNQPVVDAIINQKYRYAQMKNIAFILIANDLSNITICEEDLVTILANILDNGIEACEKLKGDKILKFKIVIEDEQLLITAHNPVEEPIKIIKNRILTTKDNKKEHGLGLLNIYAVVEKYKGTYAIQCKDGWFYLSVLIPL